MPMIFAPLSAAQLRELLSAGALGATAAFTATGALRADHGLGPREDEEADFAAFRHATIQATAAARIPGVAGAEGDAAGGNERLGRIVVAAEVPAADTGGEASGADLLGRIEVARLRRQDVTAVYLDEEAAWPALATARAVLDASSDLGEVIDAPVVRALLDDHAMLWHLPTEVAD